MMAQNSLKLSTVRTRRFRYCTVLTVPLFRLPRGVVAAPPIALADHRAMCGLCGVRAVYRVCGVSCLRAVSIPCGVGL